jgi:hypothetical protein
MGDGGFSKLKVGKWEGMKVGRSCRPSVGISPDGAWPSSGMVELQFGWIDDC